MIANSDSGADGRKGGAGEVEGGLAGTSPEAVASTAGEDFALDTNNGVD